MEKQNHQQTPPISLCRPQDPITNQMLLISKRRQFFIDLIRLQNELNQQLIINSGLLNTYQAVHKNFKNKISSSDTSTNPSSHRNSNQQKNQKRPSIQKLPKNKQKKNAVKSMKKKRADSDYEPEESFSNPLPHSRLSQTKNVPKNYGKAIIGFIKRSSEHTKRVLDHLKIDNENFYIYIDKLKGKINTIAQLRSLWIEEENPYAKAFRILSMQYLRKYSLSHIFNSRVQNYGKHVKYRYKIANGLQKPYQFTQIKDF